MTIHINSSGFMLLIHFFCLLSEGISGQLDLLYTWDTEDAVCT